MRIRKNSKKRRPVPSELRKGGIDGIRKERKDMGGGKEGEREGGREEEREREERINIQIWLRSYKANNLT